MGGILLYSAVIFFLSFGIISCMGFIRDFFYETKYLKNKTVYTIVPVENEACSIENIVRAVKFKVEKSCSGVCDCKLFFVDTGSSDATYSILKRLEKTDKEIIAVKTSEISKKLDFFQ